ncbi:MAG: 4-phosphoerythronate dehydrogenase, partial [Candidatus Amulumruptor sp.]|nr:4-phosphoerythronate dehydrogenase [Candidatus Amulumruptor sp.]
PAPVAGADALIIRTRTRADEALRGASAVKFVATATIGTDHIDLDWCRSRGITTASAPGCNAPGVAQYVIAAAMQLGYKLPDTTIGIVGVGNVGSIVEKWARGTGMRVMLCDPPRARREGSEAFSTLDDIAGEADIITFHTPLTASGPDATRHLISDTFLGSCRRKPTIINAARGAVADTEALIRAVDNGIIAAPVIDCWEGEPAISRELLSRAAIATPHIAGYSREGKMRATEMALTAFCDYFGLPMPAPLPDDLSVASAPAAEAVASSYDIMADDAMLRSDPASFEHLRNTYNYRHEPR